MTNKYDFGRFPKVEYQKEWAAKLLREASKLNKWELEFVTSMSWLLQNNKKLNETQVYKLETIYANKTN